MGIIKKTLILSNNELNHKGMATLNLEKKGKDTHIHMKVYYLDQNQESYLLGIACDDKQVCLQDVTLKGTHVVQFKTSNDIDLNKKITVVLVTKQEFLPVLWGSTNKLDDTRFAMIKGLKEQNDEKKVERLQDESVMIAQKPIEKMVEAEPVFYQEEYENKTNLFEEVKDEELDVIINDAMEEVDEISFFESEMGDFNKKENFYEQIKEQIEEVFEHSETESTLEKLIPNSRWVKVEEEGTKHYVLGLLYAHDQLQYIAYGVQGDQEMLPPAEFRAYSQWLPIHPEKENSSGYWVMYQDAATGENCLVDEKLA